MEFIIAKECGFGVAMIPIRLAFIEGNRGSGLFEICELIGKEETIAMIKTSISKIQ